MSRFLSTLLWIFLSGTLAFGQSSKPRFPRETQKLIDRAQEYWDGIVAGQPMKAINLVLPERRDAFIVGSPMPILAAKVVSIDVTDDVNRATVRVEVAMLSTEAGSRQSFSMVNSLWAWQRNNWYADVGNVNELLNSSGASGGVRLEELRRDLDRVKLVNTTIDIGKVIIRQNLQYEIPVVYEGASVLDVESILKSDFFGVAAGQKGLTSSSPKFLLFVNTLDLAGPFSIPLQLRFQIRNEAPSVERTLIVRGDVFAPLTFRRVSPEGPNNPKDPVTVYIKNNTNEPVEIKSIVCDAFDILKSPSMVAPGSESEVVMRLHPGATPDQLVVIPERPLFGLASFEYRFPAR